MKVKDAKLESNDEETSVAGVLSLERYGEFYNEGYRWLTCDDRLLRPKDMETSHLFNTLRMIWNHSVAEEFQINPFHEYEFPDNYTKEYFKESVTQLFVEIVKREDIEKGSLKDLLYMFECYGKAVKDNGVLIGE